MGRDKLINIDQYCSNSRHLTPGRGSKPEYGHGSFFKIWSYNEFGKEEQE